MIVQNNYTPFLILALVILGITMALGSMANEKLNQTQVIPSIPTTSTQRVANADLVLTNQHATTPATPTPQVTPPAMQTVQAALAQATLERITQTAVEFRATQVALAVKQTETATQQTRVAEQGMAQQTRTAQDVGATATRQAIETSQANEKQNNANIHEMLINVLLSFGGLALIICICGITVVIAHAKLTKVNIKESESRAREKEAQAKTYAEHRRLLEVQTAIESKQGQKSTQVLTSRSSAHQIPRNGHNGQDESAKPEKGNAAGENRRNGDLGD